MLFRSFTKYLEDCVEIIDGLNETPSNLFFDASLTKESRDKDDFSLLSDCSVILDEIEIFMLIQFSIK